MFTGNTALVTAAYKEGKIEGKALIKNWVASYAGNFVGSLLLAYLAFKSGTLASGPASAAIATAKCSLPWDVASFVVFSVTGSYVWLFIWLLAVPR